MSRLLVAIHDVTPAHAAATQRLWTSCRALGLQPALCVVPAWHGDWPLERHPEFVEWLHACVEEGADILLHGWRHDEIGVRRGWRDEIRAFGRTAREGEFLTLDQRSARDRIRRGLRRLHALNLAPIGFVPPAWLAQATTRRAAASLQLPLIEDAGALYLARRTGRPMRLPAPVIRWSTRSALRAWMSVGVAALRRSPAWSPPLLRVALHPLDLSHAATSRSLERTLAHWSRRAPPIRYRDVIHGTIRS